VSDWLAAVTLDFLHTLCGASPLHKLVLCLGGDNEDLYRALARLIASTNIILALKAMQVSHGQRQHCPCPQGYAGES
jgi:hypothetical protein